MVWHKFIFCSMVSQLHLACLPISILTNSNNNQFYIETYHSLAESQTALQSVITPADQFIIYIEMLSLQTLHRNVQHWNYMKKKMKKMFLRQYQEEK